MVEIKHLCLCLLFSSTHFSVYKDTFAFYKDTKCVQGHAILMPADTCNEKHCMISRYCKKVYSSHCMQIPIKLRCQGTAVDQGPVVNTPVSLTLG